MTDPTDLPEPDVARITRALREYHAAQNSCMRAIQELLAAIPEGCMLLHRKPGDQRGLFWAYFKDRGMLSYTAGREEIAGEYCLRAVVVEAPAPREEHLPRLDTELAALAYECGCQAVLSRKVQAFCPTHLKALAGHGDTNP